MLLIILGLHLNSYQQLNIELCFQLSLGLLNFLVIGVRIGTTWSQVNLQAGG